MKRYKWYDWLAIIISIIVLLICLSSCKTLIISSIDIIDNNNSIYRFYKINEPIDSTKYLIMPRNKYKKGDTIKLKIRKNY